jgi:uncharacterized protein YggU (UPF0235/DUF167 family)
MISYSEKDGLLSFKVRVVPRASRSELAGEHDGALRVRIAAAPVDNAANEELLRLLADVLALGRSSIQITAGHASKLKTVCLASVGPAVLERLRQL